MPRFWLLVTLVSVTPFVLTALLINHVALFGTIGWSAMDVARALQGYAVAGVVMTYLTGTMLDRVPAKLGVLTAMALLALGLLVPVGLRSSPFGVGSVGAIKGIVGTVRNGVTAAAAPLGAWMIDQRGGFSTVLLAGAALAGVTGCVFLPSRPDRSCRSRSGSARPR